MDDSWRARGNISLWILGAGLSAFLTTLTDVTSTTETVLTAIAMGCLITAFVIFYWPWIKHPSEFLRRFHVEVFWVPKAAGRVELHTVFHGYAEPARETGCTLLSEIMYRLQQQEAAHRCVSTLLRGRILDPMNEAVAIFNNELMNPESRDRYHLQTLLGDYYRKYSGVTTWIRYGGELVSFKFEDDNLYLDWERKHISFMKEIWALSLKQKFSALRAALNETGENPWPTLPP